MLKNILNLEGAQKLTKNEQKSINGGLDKSYTCKDLLCPLNAPCVLFATGPKCVVNPELPNQF